MRNNILYTSKALMLTYINRTTNTHQSSYQTATILSWFLSIHSIYFALSKPLPSFQDLQIRKDFMKFSKSHLPAIMTMIVIVMIVILTMLGILGFILCIFGYMTFKVKAVLICLVSKYLLHSEQRWTKIGKIRGATT